MKAKTLMGMIACAGACVSLSAFGNNTNNWFNAGVADSNITLSGVSTNGVAVQVSDGKIVLDNEKESALTFTPVKTNMSTGVSVIRAKAELTPSDANFDTPLEGAKVGFAVGVAGNATNYYGFASGEWFKLDGVNPPYSGNTEFQLILDYRSATAQFFVKDSDSYQILSTNNGTTTAFAFAKGDASDISGIDAYGSGSITSLDGKFELAVAAYNGTKYGSIAEAVDAAGANKANVLPVSESGETPTGGTTAANDLPKIVCAVLNLDPADPNAQAKAVPVENDSETSYVTLQVPVTEAGVVEFEVRNNNGGSVNTYDASAIKIPTGTGVYTVTPVLK